MNKTYLPHQRLFDELQVAMIPITKELSIVSSMLKWTKATVDRSELPMNFGWMLSGEVHLSTAKQIEKISSLRKSTQELHLTIKELMHHILEFSSFKSIEKNLIAFHKSYLEIPSIDNEMHLLYLGADLLHNGELLAKLLTFTEKLQKLTEASSLLKKAIIDHMLQGLSFTLDSQMKPSSI